MQIKKSRSLIFVLLILATGIGLSCYSINPRRLQIRINQVGFYTNDYKSGNIFSDTVLDDLNFEVKDIRSNKTVHKGSLGKNFGKWGAFPYNYKIDFSDVNTEGSYYVEAAGNRSFNFKIGSNTYNGILDSLLTFFRVQRCGPTNPYLHDVCHLYDSPNVEGDPSAGKVDLTGGWHDAGDYTKFFSTTSLSTYFLLFAYDLDKSKFEFDKNRNGAPDILDEARIGLDFLLRCNYQKLKLIIQVQNLKDQTVGWRMPEKDSLKFQRPAYAGIGKNQIGMFAAVMSLASRIWKDRFQDRDFSEKCLRAAENIYSLRNSAPDVDKNPVGLYQDTRFWGKLELGAIEMYKTTNQREYLDDAIKYCDNAGADYWWSWGDINSISHFRVAPYYAPATNYILQNLTAFNDNSNKSIFGEGTTFSWGTTHTFLGIALQAILYKKLTGSSSFDSLAASQRDYILGKNPWGVSFIYGFGTQFTKNFHSQVAYFNGGYLPGGISAGPAPLAVLQNYNIQRTNYRYNQYNSEDVFYYDDKNDYVTNEPTIVTNATALIVFGHFK